MLVSVHQVLKSKKDKYTDKINVSNVLVLHYDTFFIYMRSDSYMIKNIRCLNLSNIHFSFLALCAYLRKTYIQLYDQIQSKKKILYPIAKN